MYWVPGTECEFSNFQTGADNSGGDSVRFPRGGHNYYNGRDMEKLQNSAQGHDDRGGKNHRRANGTAIPC